MFAVDCGRISSRNTTGSHTWGGVLSGTWRVKVEFTLQCLFMYLNIFFKLLFGIIFNQSRGTLKKGAHIFIYFFHIVLNIWILFPCSTMGEKTTTMTTSFFLTICPRSGHIFLVLQVYISQFWFGYQARVSGLWVMNLLKEKCKDFFHYYDMK